ncbi:unnamed protein product [Xylocopa violacea]|uniref:Uncharacterized protein n=1 Tax=Xylocopa violacea TaxID=135666 RepID=A0ABP1N5Y9_XYLVO
MLVSQVYVIHKYECSFVLMYFNFIEKDIQRFNMSIAMHPPDQRVRIEFSSRVSSRRSPVIPGHGDVASKVGLNTGGASHRTLPDRRGGREANQVGEQNTWTTSCQGVSTSVFRKDRFTSVARVHVYPLENKRRKTSVAVE